MFLASTIPDAIGFCWFVREKVSTICNEIVIYSGYTVIIDLSAS